MLYSCLNFSESGMAVCKPCEPGTYSNISGAINCELCPPGEYALKEGAVMCATCNPGTFAPDNGSTACETCAPGIQLHTQPAMIMCVSHLSDDNVCITSQRCVSTPLSATHQVQSLLPVVVDHDRFYALPKETWVCMCKCLKKRCCWRGDIRCGI